jgi:hypothetical protein
VKLGLSRRLAVVHGEALEDDHTHTNAITGFLRPPPAAMGTSSHMASAAGRGGGDEVIDVQKMQGLLIVGEDRVEYTM